MPRTRSQSGDNQLEPNVTFLRNLLDSLDRAPRRIDVFFRDDDAGWGHDRLIQLIDLFGERSLPLDLAVIPAELTPALASELRARDVGLHQHGYAHTNHELSGRKHEFGPSRRADLQRADILRGREVLLNLLGDRLDPFFTPPWNRCTRDTARVLAELDYALLSREHRAEPFGLLPELPVHVDVARLAPDELDAHFARLVDDGEGPIGVMFHHAVMEPDDYARADELLGVLAGHANVVPRAMAELSGPAPSAGRSCRA
jgi:hypothetical protein